MTAKAHKSKSEVSDLPNQPMLQDLLPFAEVARRLPRRRGGRPTHLATLHRWRASGLKGIRLECLRVGGTWCTTLENVERFFSELTTRGSGDKPGQSPRCLPQRHHVSQQLSKMLGD